MTISSIKRDRTCIQYYVKMCMRKIFFENASKWSCQPSHGSIPRNTACAFLRLHLAWYNCLKPTAGSGARLPQTDINPTSSPNWYQLQLDSGTFSVWSCTSYRQTASSIWSDTVRCGSQKLQKQTLISPHWSAFQVQCTWTSVQISTGFSWLTDRLFQKWE